MKAKKGLALLLMMVLAVSLFAGCGNKEKGKKEEQNQQVEKQETDDKGSKDDAGKEDTGGNTEGEEASSGTEGETGTSGIQFPLAEKEELSMWLIWTNSYKEDPNELISVQKVEENTNVHVKWTTVSSNEATEKFGLMLASGDYPELIYSAATYPNGMVKGVEDGVYLDLTEEIPKYMPNYEALRRSDETVYKDTVTDDGRSVAVYVLASDDEGIRAEKVFGGLLVRQDWLDELKLPLPETMEDWHTMLTAFKDTYHCEAPHLMFRDGMDFVMAYGVLDEFYQENGTVKYGPLEPSYREYLETMNQWYNEGLIDRNFMSSSQFWPTAADTATGRGGAAGGIWGEAADSLLTRGLTQEESFCLTAVANPVLNHGDMPQIDTGADSRISKIPVAVTKNCKNVELALSWLDYWYTEECMMLATYGVEGETYTKDSNGAVVMTDLIMNSPDGYTPMDALSQYTLGVANFGLYDWMSMDVLNSGSKALSAKDTWDAMGRDLIIPSTVTMTPDEAYQYADKYTAVQTMVQEMSIKYMTGQESFDGYDAFLDNLKKYGIEDCIAIWQAALDRYNNR